jgi:putative spermidine/putrescine transport system permease protein
MWLFAVAASLIILAPLTVLVFWCFAQAWPAPELMPDSWGLGNIETVLNIEPELAKVVLESIALSLIVAAICVIVGLLVSHSLAYYEFKGKHLIDFLTFLPIIIPTTAFGMGAHVFLLRNGLAGNVTGVILVHVVVSIPYVIKILTDSLRMMGRSLAEQAWLFGASPLRAFIDVALPSLLPSIIAAFSLAFISSYGQYFLTLIIGGSRVETLAVAMFPWITSAERGVSAVFAVIYLMSSLLIFLLLELAEKLVSKNQKNFLM